MRWQGNTRPKLKASARTHTRMDTLVLVKKPKARVTTLITGRGSPSISGIVPVGCTAERHFTGTPAGVGPLKAGDTVKAEIAGLPVLEFSIPEARS